MKFTAFLSAGSLLEFCAKVLGHALTDRPMQDRDCIRLEKAVKKATVSTTYMPPHQRKYRVVGLTRQGADRLDFDRDGTKITVAQYFMDQYNLPVKFPALPCVRCHPSRNILVPIEFLDVVDGQRKPGKLSGPQTAAVIRRAAMRPADRAGAVREVGASLAQDKFPQGFGMKINPEMLDVEGRILETPSVMCRSGKDVGARLGV
mmetsp:Transcript_21078/g.56223  ORF Transcript_21078/g.56223 Transcript_21078/m.56223 type:complete len:204 (+) Transcript_21078:579-1190(+)